MYLRQALGIWSKSRESFGYDLKWSSWVMVGADTIQILTATTLNNGCDDSSPAGAIAVNAWKI